MRKLLIFLNFFLLVSCEPESNNNDVLKKFDLFIADIEAEHGWAIIKADLSEDAEVFVTSWSLLTFNILIVNNL